jgi:hypothetical protein
MKCHNCQAKTEVEETRVIEENPRWTKRRRVCKHCGFTLWTVEMPAEDVVVEGGREMKAMYSVYDRNGDCFDFCDDEETEHSLDYDAEHDRLRVWQWSAERQSRGENNQLIAEFYQPRRFIKDFTN